MNRALLVGINAYPSQPLAGCLADIAGLAALLLDQGYFAFDEMRMLADGRATRRAIGDGLRWLVSGARRGDRLYFHFSGHGAQLPTESPAEVSQVLCPVDFDWTLMKALSDRDLGALFGALADGVDLTWTVDACHTGDFAREAALNGQPIRPRVLRPPPPIAREIGRRLEGHCAVRPLRAPAAERSLMISACWANETAADTSREGRAQGAFTSGLIRTLLEPRGKTSPVSALPSSLSDVLRVFEQHPFGDGPPAMMARAFLGASPQAPSARESLAQSAGRFDFDAPRSAPVGASALCCA